MTCVHWATTTSQQRIQKAVKVCAIIVTLLSFISSSLTNVLPSFIPLFPSPLLFSVHIRHPSFSPSPSPYRPPSLPPSLSPSPPPSLLPPSLLPSKSCFAMEHSITFIHLTHLSLQSSPIYYRLCNTVTLLFHSSSL